PHSLGADQATEVLDRAGESLAKRYFRLPAQHRACARDVRAPDLRIVLRERVAEDLGLRSSELDDHVGKIEHGVFAWIADVGWPVVTPIIETEDAVDLVVDEAKASCLAAVTIDRDRLAVERLHDEVRHHATVARPHTRSVCVEYANDADVEIVDSVKG